MEVDTFTEIFIEILEMIKLSQSEVLYVVILYFLKNQEEMII